MAISNEELFYQRWSEFTYFDYGKANGFAEISISPGKPFRIGELRIHFSGAMASVIDLVVRASSHLHSYYDFLLLSQAMLSIDTYMIGWDSSVLPFSASDFVNINCSMVSNTVGWGIEVRGWAAFG